MEEENGLSIGEIFKVIFKRIWWLLGAAAIGVLIVVLVTQLWYNKKTQYYSVSFEIIYPNSESGKYPNGSEFLPADCISYETLTDIKAGKYSASKGEEFINVNVEEMREKDDITLTLELSKAEDNSIVRTYTLNVIASYFENEEQAVSFLRTVASYPIHRINSILAEREYWLNLTTYENAKTYEDKIAALSAQKEYLQNSYTSLSEYNNNLEVKISELRNVFTSVQKQALTDRIKANFYILDTEEYEANAEYRKAALRKTIEENEKIIAALKSERDSASTQTGYAVAADDVVTNAYDIRIAELTAVNAGYMNEIADIDDTLDAIKKYGTAGTEEYAEKLEFDALLEKYCAELTAATDELRDATNTLYAENSRVIYSGNKVEKLGGINAIVSALIGLIGGAVIAAVVICIIDLPKYKRLKLAAEGVAEGGTDGGAEADGKDGKDSAK